MLDGEPGIGKTTVLREVARLLTAKGYRVLYSNESTGGAFGVLRSLHCLRSSRACLEIAALSRSNVQRCASGGMLTTEDPLRSELVLPGVRRRERTSSSLKCCRAMLASGEPSLREAAAFCLAASKYPESVSLLEQVRDDPHEPVRARARAGLRQMADAGDAASVMPVGPPAMSSCPGGMAAARHGGRFFISRPSRTGAPTPALES